jgi:phage tail protein X
VNKISFTNQETLGDLVDRLFEIKAGGKATRDQLTGALLDANPHLSEYDNVPAGTPVVVPDVQGVTSAKHEHPLNLLVNDSLEQIIKLMDDLNAAMQTAANQQVQETTRATGLLKSARFKKFAEEAAPEQIPLLQDQAMWRADQAKAVRTAQKAAQAEMEKDVAGLRELAAKFANQVGAIPAGQVAQAKPEPEPVTATETKAVKPKRKRGKRNKPHSEKPGDASAPAKDSSAS